MKRGFYLKVDKIHKIWIDDSEAGSDKGRRGAGSDKGRRGTGREREGVPLLILHGGPGAPYGDDVTAPVPKGYRTIVFHQRGCGMSKPLGCLIRNSPRYLIKDIEKIRKHLGIDKFVIDGGSFGAFLAVAYAEKHPTRVKALIIRGLSLMNETTLRVSKVVAPDVWHSWNLADTHQKTTKMYLKYLKRKNKKYVKRYINYSKGLFKLMKFRQGAKYKKNKYHNDWAQALISAHYGTLIKKTKCDGIDILKNAHRLRKIPGYVIHGRNDMMTAPENSYNLVERWNGKNVTLVFPNYTGHRRNDYGILKHTKKAYRKFLKLSL